MGLLNRIAAAKKAFADGGVPAPAAHQVPVLDQAPVVKPVYHEVTHYDEAGQPYLMWQDDAGNLYQPYYEDEAPYEEPLEPVVEAATAAVPLMNKAQRQRKTRVPRDPWSRRKRSLMVRRSIGVMLILGMLAGVGMLVVNLNPDTILAMLPPAMQDKFLAPLDSEHGWWFGLATVLVTNIGLIMFLAEDWNR